MAKVIAIANQKGGVGKTVTTENLGVGLARMGKRVLLVDVDAQGSLTASMGYRQPDQLPTTLATMLGRIMSDEPADPSGGILRHTEGVDLMPANIELSGIEVALVNVMSRESVLKELLAELHGQYDYILLDCTPSLGMLTINALAAADSVLIPVQAQYLSLKGLEQLIRTIGKVHRQINPSIAIEGLLLTMVNLQTNYARDIIALLNKSYGERIHIFQQVIPLSVRAQESTAEGVSIYTYRPGCKVALAYEALTKEVLSLETQRG